jgi:hypothetical protein
MPVGSGIAQIMGQTQSFLNFSSRGDLRVAINETTWQVGLVALAFARSVNEVLGILVIYLATILNQLLLVEGVFELVGASNKVKVVLLFLTKMAILFGALAFGVHLMGKRVIIPLLNYVVIIFVLGTSLKDKRDNPI